MVKGSFIDAVILASECCLGVSVLAIGSIMSVYFRDIFNHISLKDGDEKACGIVCKLRTLPNPCFLACGLSNCTCE